MLYLITGPPASGKSTWVREHARHGDITIDYDALAAALTPPGGRPHDWPAEVKSVTKAARQAAIDTAITQANSVDVYVIHSSPSQRLLQHYRDHGAKVITIDPGRDVVLARAKRERPWRIQQAAKDWYTQQTAHTVQQTPADQTRQW
ncbi:AAA family ATPase [Mycolicibacterium austroafricanum]|uniref:AAA family ATPase n=1 Tax=Mycolicibacterium austroafricanum TaxID=39687 RepID=UPI001ABF5A5F|nr:AAA family ATPase [Mycolicibacterium austroafricanum]QRZ05901.1 AAA family ATPase [Mycolicibacterium austroafricanum]